MEWCEGLKSKTEAVHDARPEILHNDVAGRGQLPCQLDSRRRLQVDQDVALVVVDASVVVRVRSSIHRLTHESGAVPTPGLLDLEHLSTHVGEPHGGERSGGGVSEVEDADSLKWRRRSAAVHSRKNQARGSAG